MLKTYIYWHKCWCHRCGTDEQQAKIELLSFWSVNRRVSQLVKRRTYNNYDTITEDLSIPNTFCKANHDDQSHCDDDECARDDDDQTHVDQIWRKLSFSEQNLFQPWDSQAPPLTAVGISKFHFHKSEIIIFSQIWNHKMFTNLS